jgi:hypothetical protein
VGDNEAILHIWLAQAQSLGRRVLQLDENLTDESPRNGELSKFGCPCVLELLVARPMVGEWPKVRYTRSAE